MHFTSSVFSLRLARPAFGRATDSQPPRHLRATGPATGAGRRLPPRRAGGRRAGGLRGGRSSDELLGGALGQSGLSAGDEEAGHCQRDDVQHRVGAHLPPGSDARNVLSVEAWLILREDEMAAENNGYEKRKSYPAAKQSERSA
jgi:hypothetical protein